MMSTTKVTRKNTLNTKPPISNTINVKGHRKLVQVVYTNVVEFYKIPDGLDLEDTTIVENWRVKNQRLWIDFVNGRQENYPPNSSMIDNFKYPDDQTIEDADDNQYFDKKSHPYA